MKCSAKSSEHLDFEDIHVVKLNDALQQFSTFAHCIATGAEPPANAETAYYATDIANHISEKIKLRTNIFSD